MAVSGVEHKAVNAGIGKRLCTVKHVGSYAESGSAKESVILITGSIGILDSLFNILDCNKTCKLAVAVNKRKLFNLGLHKYCLGVLKGCAVHGGNKLLFWSHNLGNSYIVIGHKAKVAVCENTYKRSVIFTNRHAADVIVAHQLVSVLDSVTG